MELFRKTCRAFLLLWAVVAPTTRAVDASSSSSMLRSLNRVSTRMLAFDNAVDTTQTVYAEEAQAWRMLGLYTDCEAQQDGTSICEKYLLWAAVSTNSAERVNQVMFGKAPYLTSDHEQSILQYVDEDYSGAGQGEYMFYDSESGKWDDSACELAGSKRCVKMDCHLPVSVA